MTGAPIKLLLDEHIWLGLTEALTQRGYDAIHVINEDLRNIDDEPLMGLAASQGRAVLTYNVRDFVPLVAAWYEAGKEHAGQVSERSASNPPTAFGAKAILTLPGSNPAEPSQPQLKVAGRIRPL